MHAAKVAGNPRLRIVTLDTSSGVRTWVDVPSVVSVLNDIDSD